MHSLSSGECEANDFNGLSLADIFRSTTDEFWLWCQTTGVLEEKWLAKLLPGMPAEEILLKYEDISGTQALRQANGFFRHCKRLLTMKGLALGPDKRVLEFGCGWGALTRQLLKEICHTQLVCVDIWDEMIQSCLRSKMGCEFIQIPRTPPLYLFQDDRFDYIFAYSAFTSLSESYTTQWVGELSRMLKPGGVLFIGVTPVGKVDLTGDAGECYQAGKFCFQEDTKKSGGIENYYGQALFSEDYAVRTYGKWFENIELELCFDMYLLDRDCMVLQKKELNGVDKNVFVDKVVGSAEGQYALENELPWTGERMVPTQRGPGAVEHLHRYALACELVTGKIVLDIASGEGYGASLLAKRAKQVYGIDNSRAVVGHAREKYANSGIQFLEGTAEAIPLPDHSVDVIVSFETIEHLSKPELFLSEIKRCLKQEGVLIISSPARGPYNAIYPEPNEFHLHELSHQEFVAMLSKDYKNMVVGTQKYLQGSYMVSDCFDLRVHSGTYTGDFQSIVYQPGTKDGAYSIVICSDAALATVPLGIFETTPALVDGVTEQIIEKEKEATELQKENRILEKTNEIKNKLVLTLSRFLSQAHQEIEEGVTEQKQIRIELRSLMEEAGETLAETQKLYEVEKQEKEVLQQQLDEQKLENNDHQQKSKDLQRRYELTRQTSELRMNDLRKKIVLSTLRFYYLKMIISASRKMAMRKLTQWLSFWDAPPASKVKSIFFYLFLPVTRFSQKLLQNWASRKKICEFVRNSGLFNRDYYLTSYPEVASLSEDPLKHYLRIGAQQGKNPNAYFDTRYYLGHNPDVVTSGINPLVHFISSGAAEERDPGPNFDTNYYMLNNPDVLKAGLVPFIHFYLYGNNEGRMPKSMLSTENALLSLESVGPDLVERVFSDNCNIEVDPDCFKKKRKQHDWETWEKEPHVQAKLIAFYLPQFHPIPENDEWWGKGFTEWENVVKGIPFFKGHDQPHLPADLGYYDLRIADVQEKQAEMAKAFGIYGFCYYYYWFNGRRLLESPLNTILESGKPDFPFCICWANENWTRTWDGHDNYILMEQKHSLESDIEFIHDVIPILKDSRYIQFHGKPLLLVYRVDKLATPLETTKKWRAICSENGIPEIHLCAIKFAGFDDPKKWGFDAMVEFPPNSLLTPNVADAVPDLHPEFRGRISDYRDMRNHCLNYPETPYMFHRGLMPRWDNTARRGFQSIIFKNSGPQEYEEWLRELVAREQKKTDQDSLIFINAWNEWAEGAHLEPDQRYGYAFLEATLRAITGSQVENLTEGDQTCLPESQVAVDENQETAQNTHVSKEVLQAESMQATSSSSRRGIALIVHDALSYGVELHTLAIAKMIAKRHGGKIFVVLKQGGELEPEFAKVGTVLNLATMTRDLISESVALEKICKQIKSAGVHDAISCTTITGDVATYFKKHHFNLITLVNELTTLVEAYGYYELMIQSLNASDKLVFPSQYVCDAYAERYQLDLAKQLIRPQGILDSNLYLSDRQRARRLIAQKHGLEEDFRMIINVASGDALRKGPDIFMNVAQQVLKHPGMGNVQFVWIGALQGEAKIWCEHDAKKILPTGHIHLVGFQKDVALYMAAAELFLLTSREDPFPNVMLSAMEAGLPVVAFEESGGAAELLLHGNGLLVPFLDVGAMVRQVITLLEDEHLRHTVGEKAAATIKADFQFEDYVEFLLEQFDPKKK